VIATLAQGSSALAQPSAADKDTARELLRQGYELRDKGDHRGALEKLSQAHALVATPITTHVVAREHAELKHLIEARELAASVARIPVAPNESEGTQNARRQAAELAESLKGKIPTLTVTLTNVPPTRRATITIDGVAKTPEPGGTAYAVNPGKHVVAARVENGAESQSEVSVEEGEHKTVTFTPELPPTTLDASVTGSASVEGDRPGRSSLVYIGFGAAVAGLAAGTITGVMALSKAGTSECEGNRCTSAGIDDVETGRTLALVSTISFGVAAVGVGVGIWGLALGSSKRTAWQLVPTATGGLVRGAF
jgi:hypothetical protein